MSGPKLGMKSLGKNNCRQLLCLRTRRPYYIDWFFTLLATQFAFDRYRNSTLRHVSLLYEAQVPSSFLSRTP